MSRTAMFIVKRNGLPGSIENSRFTGIDDDGISNLVGKVLTNMEAAMPEGTQLTALKSLIQSTIYTSLSHGTSMAYSISDMVSDSGVREITVNDPWEDIPQVNKQP